MLEREILATFAADVAVQRALFVGVQWYTKHYAALFTGKVFASIDPEARLTPFGGEPHAVGSVQDLATHFPGFIFDAIVMSGVIGFGLNDPSEVDKALAACASALRPGGWLVLGVNPLKPTHVDPSKSPASCAFAPCRFGARNLERIDVTLPFRERQHTFLFWQRKG